MKHQSAELISDARANGTNCLICTSNQDSLPHENLDSEILTSLLTTFEDCFSITIHDKSALLDQGVNFCHDCILNLDLWKYNHEEELKYSANARQLKARIAAQILLNRGNDLGTNQQCCQFAAARILEQVCNRKFFI